MEKPSAEHEKNDQQTLESIPLLRLPIVGADFEAKLQSVISRRLSSNPRDELSRDLIRLISRVHTIQFYAEKIQALARAFERLPLIDKGAPYFPTHLISPPGNLVLLGREIGIQFETLVLHCLAGLDHLSVLVTRHCHGTELRDPSGRLIKPYFSNLQDRLMASQRVDIRSEWMFRMLDECAPELLGIILPDSRNKTIRNLIAHESNLLDLTKSSFSLFFLEDGRVLRFDCEVGNFPLVQTARNLVWNSVYLILRSVGIFAARTATGSVLLGEWAWLATRPHFRPVWDHQFVYWRDYQSSDKTHPEFEITRLDDLGIHTETVHLLPEVYRLATSPT